MKGDKETRAMNGIPNSIPVMSPLPIAMKVLRMTAMARELREWTILLNNMNALSSYSLRKIYLKNVDYLNNAFNQFLSPFNLAQQRGTQI